MLGAIKAVKYLIDGSTQFNILHGSKKGSTKEHSWNTFTSDKFLIDAGRKKPNPLIIKCPKCGKEGRVNEYHPRAERADVTRFYVKHEYVGGYWGTINRVRRFRRCYFNRDQRFPN